MGEVKAAVDPEAVSADFLICLRVSRPLAWLWHVIHCEACNQTDYDCAEQCNRSETMYCGQLK